MESFLFLLGLIALAAIVAAYAGFFLSLGARSRIDRIEAVQLRLDQQLAQLQTLLARTPSAATATPPPLPDTAPTATAPAIPPSLPPPLPVMQTDARAADVHDAAGSLDEAARAASAAAAAERSESGNIADEAVFASGSATATIGDAPGETLGASHLELAIGTRWTVWIGGATLALGFIFLVRHSIEAGLFGPGVRLTMAAAMSIAAIALGEVLRRKDLLAGRFDAFPTAQVPAILTAAGASGLFATVWAAHALHSFLGTGVAFVVLGAVGVATVLAALVHGPWLGVLGILGSYATPILVESTHPAPSALVMFLLVVTTTTFVVARMRLWRAVASVAFGAAVFWGVTIVALTSQGSFGNGWAMLYAVALFTTTVSILVASLADLRFEPRDTGLDLYGLVVTALASLLVLAAFTVTTGALAHVGLVVVLVGLMTLAALVAPTVQAAPVAALLAVLAAAADRVDVVRAFASDTSALGPDGLVLSTPQAIVSWLTFHGAVAALLAGTSLVMGLRATGRANRAAGWWMLAGSSGPILTTFVAWGRVSSFSASAGFAAVLIAFGAVLAWIAGAATKRETPAEPALSVAVVAVGAITSLAGAAAVALDRGVLTLTLAAMVPAIAWVHGFRPMGVLRGAAAIVAGIVLVRVGRDPAIVADLSSTPVFNGLLIGYGLPTLGTAYAAYAFRKAPADLARSAIEAAALVFAGVFAMIEVRHIVNGGDLWAPTISAAEVGLDVALSFVFAIGLDRLSGRTGGSIVAATVAALPFVTAIAAVLGSGFYFAEAMTFGGSGWTMGELALAYLVPGLVGAVAARLGRLTGRPNITVATRAITAYGLGFAFVTLLVRKAFHGSHFPVSWDPAESWVLSVVWLTWGVATLLVGLKLGSRPVRLLSAAVVTLTCVKVFILDLAGLEGVWRAFSFIGLGTVLIGIAFVYQRFLSPPQPDERP